MTTPSSHITPETTELVSYINSPHSDTLCDHVYKTFMLDYPKLSKVNWGFIYNMGLVLNAPTMDGQVEDVDKCKNALMRMIIGYIYIGGKIIRDGKLVRIRDSDKQFDYPNRIGTRDLSVALLKSVSKDSSSYLLALYTNNFQTAMQIILSSNELNLGTVSKLCMKSEIYFKHDKYDEVIAIHEDMVARRLVNPTDMGGKYNYYWMFYRAIYSYHMAPRNNHISNVNYHSALKEVVHFDSSIDIMTENIKFIIGFAIENKLINCSWDKTYGTKLILDAYNSGICKLADHHVGIAVYGYKDDYSHTVTVVGSGSEKTKTTKFDVPHYTRDDLVKIMDVTEPKPEC